MIMVELSWKEFIVAIDANGLRGTTTKEHQSQATTVVSSGEIGEDQKDVKSRL